MTNIWTLERGEYSDYHVIGVFSSEENAKAVAEKLEHDVEVVCRVLDPGVADLNEGRRLYCVLMLRDGTTEKAYEAEMSTYEFNNALDLPRIWPRSTARGYRETNTPDALQATVWATDEAHAVKIVNEHRTRMIADGEWP